MRSLRSLVVACAALALIPATANAKWFGSTMKGSANATYGCSTALAFDGLGNLGLFPTNQKTCTYRHGGYLFRNRFTSVVPGTGRIHQIRVKSGPHPAKLRVTILTGSSRVSTFYPYRDLPGTYTCCTARAIGKAFRPKANRTTVRKVNIKVYDVRSGKIQHRIHSTDVMALTAVSKGTLPLHIRRDVGNSYATGTPTAIGFWPGTKRGDPRVDGYAMTGMDLLFGWDWRRR